MKKLLLFCIVGSFISATSQNLNLKWAKAIATNTTGNFVVPMKLATDQHLNVYAVGYFEGTVDFDPGSAAFNLSSSGQQDGFVLKLDSSGTFVWAAKFGSTGKDYAYDVVVDAAGNVIIGGAFQYTVDFDPGSGTYLLSASNPGYRNAYVCKLTGPGNFSWAKNWGGYDGSATALTVDGVGNVFCAGNFEGGDFDPGPATVTLSAQLGGNLYLNKLDPNGNLIWVKNFGGQDYENVNCMQLDNSGNVVMGGAFRATADFDPGTGTYTLGAASANFDDAFLVKVDGSGGFLWASAFGAATNDQIDELVIDTSDNIYITGMFQHIVDFDAGPGTYTLTNPGNIAAMVCKYDPQGSIIWGISNYNSSGNLGDMILGTGIALDDSARVIVSGRLAAYNVDFNPGPGSYTLSAAGGEDMFIQVLSNTGAFLGAGLMGGTGTEYNFDLVLDQSGNIFTTGQFEDVCDFQPGSGTSTLSTGNTYLKNGFVAKLRWGCLAPGAPIISNTTLNYCKGGQILLNATGSSGTISWYTSYSGGASIGTGATYIAPSGSTGVFTYFAQENTCQPSARSGVTITVHSPTIQITTQTPTICMGEPVSLQASGALSYQWSNQSSGSLLTVSPPATAVYSVTGTDQYGCNNTASLTLVVNNCTGMNESSGQRFLVFPNPARALLFITAGDIPSGSLATIYDVSGRKVLAVKIEIENAINISSLTPGIYTLFVSNGIVLRKSTFVRE